MSTVQEARKLLDLAAAQFGKGVMATAEDAKNYIDCRDALIAAARAEGRAEERAEAERRIQQHADDCAELIVRKCASSFAEGRAEERARCVAVVEGMQRWDQVDIDEIVWTIGHDSEGEYLYRSDVVRAITIIKEAK